MTQTVKIRKGQTVTTTIEGRVYTGTVIGTTRGGEFLTIQHETGTLRTAATFCTVVEGA